MVNQTNKDLHKEKVKMLPQEPGIYRFFDKEGVIIYIGKAKNLKNRVSQYFHAEGNLSNKTRVMVSKIASIDHTVVNNEEDALLLENNLIKEFLPRYNIMLKDDKSYPWIVIKNESFPRVFLTRKIIKDGSQYYGPYSSVNFAYNLLELIKSIYYIRDCKLSLTNEKIRSKCYRPCLNYHIGKCLAPCVGEFNSEEYLKQISNIKSLLKGDSGKLIKEFKDLMNNASSDRRYEEAQLYKEKIELINKHNSKSLVVSQTISDVDIFTLVFDNSIAFGNYMRIIKGAIIQSLNLEFRLPIEEKPESVLSIFIAEIISKFGELSKEIIVPFLPDQAFANKKLHIPQKGDKLSLIELSLKNAKLFKLEKIKQEEVLRPEEHRSRIMNSIQKDLNLPSPPLHIECFDNSNIQGNHAVSACVVFKNGVPSKRDYRHYNIKTVEGPDDYASMKEVVYRRYSRLLEESSSLPQLIVIDGGRGQLNIAYQTLVELKLENRIAIIGLAKRLEEIIIPGDPNPLFLDKNSSTLRLLMQLRDEAHRFGITHHRNKRSKSQIDSILRSIPGVGLKTEQKLLSKYKSTKSILSASHEDLINLVGEKLTNTILNFLADSSKA